MVDTLCVGVAGVEGRGGVDTLTDSDCESLGEKLGEPLSDETLEDDTLLDALGDGELLVDDELLGELLSSETARPAAAAAPRLAAAACHPAVAIPPRSPTVADPQTRSGILTRRFKSLNKTDASQSSVPFAAAPCTDTSRRNGPADAATETVASSMRGDVRVSVTQLPPAKVTGSVSAPPLPPADTVDEQLQSESGVCAETETRTSVRRSETVPPGSAVTSSRPAPAKPEPNAATSPRTKKTSAQTSAANASIASGARRTS